MELLSDELPQVRIGDCGCILLADAKPIGYRFKLTHLGDVRTLVYGCPQHTYLGPHNGSGQAASQPEAPNRRSRRPGRVAKALAAP